MTSPGRKERIRLHPPWHFRLAKWLIRHRVPGGFRMIEAAQRAGMLDTTVRFDLGRGVTLDVPLARRENQWDAVLLQQYERELVEQMAEAIRGLEGPVTLIDCGADIGTFSALLVAQCSELARVVAIEPSEAVRERLIANIRRLPVAGEVLHLAVGASQGSGRLVQPAHVLKSDHARYVATDDAGPFRIMPIDELNLKITGGVAVKIDVEGDELAVLRGAAATLTAAPGLVVSVEAHPEVVARTGIDPIECVRFLSSLRPCRAHVAERPALELTGERPFFDQLGEEAIVNILCTSLP